MTHIREDIINGFAYRVYEDDDYSLEGFEPDTLSKIMWDIDSGKLSVYGIKKFTLCPCCNQLNKELDAIWGVFADLPSTALEQAITDYLG